MRFAQPDDRVLSPQWVASQRERVRALDRADALGRLREAFALPRDAAGEPLAYLCGHSLGLAPRAARSCVDQELDDWERLGVLGHEQARTPWIRYAEELQGPLAQLAGALPAEVVAMNSLTVNLHLLLASFYRPRGAQRLILMEAGAFPSDRHAVATQIGWHGLQPAEALIEIAPRAGEDCIEIEQLEALLEAHAGQVALLLWPGVQYRTGQSFDIARLVRAAHAAGALVGLDLAHAIGNVPLSLHADGADFAVWCSYKYLNGGPGAIGGAFVHERHGRQLPALAGWWGHDPATRFAMSEAFLPAHGAAAYALSNPPILSAAPLRASLPLFAGAGLAALRARSEALTAELQSLVDELAGDALTLISPRLPRERGCQLAWRVRGTAGRAERLCQQLRAEGVLCDWRAPDLIRMAPVPLYNSHEDVLRAACGLARSLLQS
jgi:kynureninase